ncbi:MAG: FG-GAP-like repeat-containing protein [Thermoanaerobaculia bacterium]
MRFLIPALLIWGVAAPASAEHPTVEQTRTEFEGVCRALRGLNPYFEDVSTERLASLAEAATEPVDEAGLRSRLGWDLIRLGRLTEAVEELGRARSLIADRGETVINLRAQILRNLANAHFQLGEDENCIGLHVASSCILPVSREAVHERPKHARIAGDLYLEILGLEPEDRRARWMLNLSRMVSGDHPEGVPERFRFPAGALDSAAEFPLWVDVAAGLGISEVSLSGSVVLDDFDGDGLLDIVTSSWDPCRPMRGYRNQGDGGFEDVSDRWGLNGQLGGLNLVSTDFDNDGMVDVMVLRGAWLGEGGQVRNSLLRNDLRRPEGRFVDVSVAAGVAYPAYPTQTAAWSDYDGDGDLDLYVGNETTAATYEPLRLMFDLGRPYQSHLYRNDGDGTFTEVGKQAGVENFRFAKGTAWGDIDNDGDPDLYVSNFGENRLYRNNGNGTFTDIAHEMGVSEPARGSFPTWFFDIDNDGDLDLFVASYEAPMEIIAGSYFGEVPPGGHPVVYRNDGDRFVDASEELGLTRPTLPMGANYGDFDNDGFPDIYLGTGAPEFDTLIPDLVYRNASGRAFEDVTFVGGFGHLQKGHGIAFGDLDNDGDQDVYHQLGGAFPYDEYGNALFENPGGEAGWIVLRLEGREANRRAIGARVEVVIRGADGEPSSVHHLVGSGGSFGASSLQAEIGLGGAAAIERIEIRWPGSDTHQIFREVEMRRFYRAVEGKPELELLELPPIRLGGADQRGSSHRHGD